jgi:hypothetical protein
MTIISKETGAKVAKGLAFIVTPTIIVVLVLIFLYWRKQKNKKILRQSIEEGAGVKPTTETEKTNA